MRPWGNHSRYDSLNRLIAASVAGSGGWGQTFAYDGFGNLWQQAVTKGTAPVMLVNVDLTTNRINSAGWGYDANGNTTQMPGPGNAPQTMEYDIDNRLVSWSENGQLEQYQYLADNKRVWKRAPNGEETVYFYGVGGQKLVTYGVTSTPFALVNGARNVYFRGKVIRAAGEAVVQDRLGSVVVSDQIRSSGHPGRKRCALVAKAWTVATYRRQSTVRRSQHGLLRMASDRWNCYSVRLFTRHPHLS
jgi:hypothetical protein